MKWTKEKHKWNKEQENITIHKVLHLTDDVDRFYESRKEGGIESIQDRADVSLQQLEDNIKMCRGILVGWLVFMAYQPLWII